MQGVILAAGRGARLGQLGQRVPKCMLGVAGRPLIQHVAESLLEGTQLHELVVVVGPAGWPAIASVEALAPQGVSVIGVVDRAQRGEVGSLAAASAHLEPRFLISDANILYEPALAESVRRRHDRDGAYATLGVTRHREEARTHLQLNVVEGCAQPHPPGERATRIYTGVGVVPKGILDDASPESNVCDVLGDRVRRGAHVAAVDYEGFYGHVATPFCLSRVRRRWSAAKLTTTPRARRSTA